MLRFKRKLPSFNTVRRGATATANLPCTGAYRSIDLILTTAEGVALTEAQIKKVVSRVRCLINAKCYFEASGKYIIDLLNRYKGLPFTAGYLHIPFTDRTFRGVDAEDMLRWGMRNVATFDIEIEIADVAEADSLIIKGEALVDNVSEDLGVIREIHEFSYASTGAGNFEVADLPKYNGSLAEMHIDCANKIKGLEFKADNVVYIEGDLGTYNTHLEREGERVPQSGYVHHDPCFTNRLRDCFTMADKSDIRYYLDMTAAQAMKFIMVTINAPLGYKAA